MAIMDFFKRKEYMAWDRYARKVAFIEDFYWQQSVREENIRNL